MNEIEPRGKLKVFLGYAEGVGKTYAMLEAGHRRKAEGQDVIVAVLDPHQQADTHALATGLECIGDNGTGLVCGPEMDTDAILSRKPHLALVDDLAHHNLPGARHERRYQDVQELLEAGINVYTTMNVQNLSSLKDVVFQITGQEMLETVPDNILDDADELEMVDIPPEELLERLRDDQSPALTAEAERRLGELAALRQMALRETAERVDDDMRDYMTSRAIQGPWAAAERVLVCVSSHPISDRLVRAGRRLAEALRAEWIVLFVETPNDLQAPPEERARLMKTMRAAEEMGAQTVLLTGESVVETVVDFSRQKNITRIVIGKPRRPRWKELLRGSRVDRLLDRCGNTDVFVISDEDRITPPRLPKKFHPFFPLRNYALAVLLTGALTLIGWGLQPWFEPASVVMLILAGVLISAAYLGTGPAVLAALLGGAVFVYWFDHSPVILTPQDARHLITVGGLLASGLVVGTLAGLLRTQIKSSRRREIHAAAVNALSRDLTVALTQDEMLSAVLKHINQSFNCPAAIFLPDGVRLSIRSATPGILLGQTELAAAQWAFEHRQQAGMGTGTHALAQVRCLPLVTTSGPVGVLAVAPREDGQFLSPDERELLAGFESLAALAIERAQLNDQARQAELLKTTEKLQAALLNSISHDLRTPLSTVSGAISSLLEAEQTGDLLDGETRLDLLENADEEADRLNRLVGNLLDMTRLEAGAMRVRKRASDVHDMIGAAITQASRRLGDHPVRTDIPEHFPDVAMDFVLMVQALYNLLDNAAKYSPPGAEITVSAEISQGELIIRVADRGLGIPPGDIEKIFDKFYRVQRHDGVGGTGLGLSICRGIVEVHGGRIWAENRSGGGAVMCVALPALVEETAA